MAPTSMRSLRGLIPAATLVAALGVTAAPAIASSVTYTASPGFSTMLLTGDADVDNVTISSDATTITITDTGPGGVTEATVECTTVSATQITCPVTSGLNSPVQQIGNDLLGSDDSLTVTTPIHVRASAGLGADTLTGGPGSEEFDGNEGNDVMSGGGGADDIEGYAGDDVISGGDGDDRYLAGNEGSDVIHGDAGNDGLYDGGPADPANPTITGTDVLDGGPGTDRTEYGRGDDVSLNLSLDGVANDGEPGEGDNLVNMETVFSGYGDDVLTGNDDTNRLVGLGGNDLISGLGGNDLIEGDGGMGSSGDDTIIPGAGADDVECSTGFDVVVVDPQDNVDAGACERIGAGLGGDDTVNLNRKGQGKVTVDCPIGEGAPCVGALALNVGGKQLGEGTFEVPAGAISKVKAKLSKSGMKKLSKAGGRLFATVEAMTTESAGDSVAAERVLLQGKAKKAGKGHGGKGGGGKGPKA